MSEILPLMRTAITAALLAVVALACSATLDTDSLAQQILTGIEDQAGVDITSVECPDDVPVEAGATFECSVTAADGTSGTVTVTQSDDQGNVTWEVTDVMQ